VKNGDHKKKQKGEEQPPWGKSIAMQREPGGKQSRDDYKKAKIAEAAVQFFEMCDLHLASLPAAVVRLRRRGAGGRHRGIIAYSFHLAAGSGEAGFQGRTGAINLKL
jgi:hypothetical protein